MTEWHIEIIDCRGRGSKTGRGATFTAEAHARAEFTRARDQVEVPSDRAEFLLDLHNPNGDLLDTICTDARGFKALTGEAPWSVEEYDAYDAKHWRQARQQRANRITP